MTELPDDIFTEPDLDPNTLANLGPLTAMAGIWEGTTGVDVHPVAAGSETDTYVERYELQPTDPQTNGPQWFYGLRYHIHITKPGEVETFHDQVGYWLWEPATGTVVQTLTIPRGQVALASGTAAPDAKAFELVCTFGSPTNGTCSIPFLDHAFRTLEYRIKVAVNGDGTWSYDQLTLLKIAGTDQLFRHTDRSTLRKVGAPAPNWLMRGSGG